MTTNLTGTEVLALLAVHKVSVSVTFLMDIGVVSNKMSYAELWQIASENGCIVWQCSGVAERLFLEDNKVMAWGRHTRKHIVRENKKKRNFSCTRVELTPDQLWQYGGNPSLVPKQFWRIGKQGRALRNIKNEPVPVESP